MTWRTVAVSLGLIVLLAGGGAADNGPAQVPEGALVGSGEWRSLVGEGIAGTWTVTLTRSGERVDGTLALRGSNVFSGGTVSGTVSDTQVVLGVLTEAGKAATFTGALDAGGIKGEWEAAVAGDHGVWFGTLARPGSDGVTP